jgi:hypothetical protein
MPTMISGGKLIGDNGQNSRPGNGNGRAAYNYRDADLDNPDGNRGLSESRRYAYDPKGVADTNEARRQVRYARGWWTNLENKNR